MNINKEDFKTMLNNELKGLSKIDIADLITQQKN